jgi:hypothetical protein
MKTAFAPTGMEVAGWATTILPEYFSISTLTRWISTGVLHGEGGAVALEFAAAVGMKPSCCQRRQNLRRRRLTVRQSAILHGGNDASRVGSIGENGK